MTERSLPSSQPRGTPTPVRPAHGKLRRRFATTVRRLSWAYLIILLALWLFLRMEGDDWWVGTVVLFGPLWITLLPAAVLIPAALFVRRRSLTVLLGAVGVCLFLLLDICIPWRTWIQPTSAGQHLRVLTCNGHYSALNEAALDQLIAEKSPDIILLQEWSRDRARPLRLQGRWYFTRHDELCIQSRYPILNIEDDGAEHWSAWGGSAMHYEIDAPGGKFQILNLHLASPHMQFIAVIEGKPSGSRQLENHLAVKTEQSEKLSQIAANLGGSVIITGDFNTPCQGSVYRQYWSQFTDAFSTAGFGLGHTYFGEGAAVRIDHIMTGLEWRCRRCWVGPDVGSPHRPVIADLERVAPGK